MHNALIKICVFILLILCGANISLSQEIPSNKGRFTVNTNRGCVPFEITVTTNNDHDEIRDRQSTIQYNFTGDDVSFYNNTTFLYESLPENQNPSTIIIKQLIQGNVPEEEKFDEIVITIYQPQQPDFYILQCLDNTIKVAIDYSQDDYEAYSIDYGDHTIEIIDKGEDYPMHTYLEEGTKTVKVKGLIHKDLPSESNANLECSESSRTFSLLDEFTRPVLSRVGVLSQDNENGQISLSHTLGAMNTYSIEISENGTGNFQHYRYIEGPADETMIDGLDTENNYYCFRLNALNACTNENLYSETNICSINLKVESGDNVNQINWSSTGFDRYHLYREPGFSTGNYIDLNDNAYMDNEVLCNQIYQYYVTGVIEGTYFSTSIILESEAVFSTIPPTPLENVTASIESNTVNFTWDVPERPAKDYYISFSNNDQNYSIIGSTTQSQYSRKENFLENISYQIHYTDECENNSEKILVKPVFLKRDKSFGADQLQWNAYQGWKNGVIRYILEVSDKNGAILDEIELDASTTFFDLTNLPAEKQVTNYRIIALGGDGDHQEAFSNKLIVDYPAQAHFPNAFTPDGNDINEEFKVAGGGRFVNELKLIIVNRWGETVFYSTEIEKGWDGSYKGNPAPQGTYIYSAEIIDEEGRKVVKRGSIQLIRTR